MSQESTWNDYPTQKPASIYNQGQTETKNFYFVGLDTQQVMVLMWHTSLIDNIARWEWPNGKVFHGTVMMWANQPDLP